MSGGSDYDRVAELLDMLGGRGRGNNSWSCPLPDHPDANPSCSTFRRRDGRTGWKCWSCNASGDLVDLLVLAGADHKEALISAGVIQDDDWGDKRGKGKGKSKSGKNRASWSGQDDAPHPADDSSYVARNIPNRDSGPTRRREAEHGDDTSRQRSERQPNRSNSRRSSPRDEEQRSVSSKQERRQSHSERSQGRSERLPDSSGASQGHRSDPSEESGGMAPTSLFDTPPNRQKSQKQPSGKVTGQRSSVVTGEDLAELLRKPKRGGKRRTRTRARPPRPEPKAEGVILRPSDAAIIEAGDVFVDSLTGQQRQMFQDWVSLWPENIVADAQIGSAIRRMAGKALPVARVPILDQTREPAGWSDRVLVKDEERRWLYSRGLSIKCVGADRLACPTGKEDCECEFCWEEIWLVEGHSDWLTGLTVSELGDAGVPVLGANGTSALPALSAIIAKKQLAYSLVIFADNDKAGAKAAAAARRAWLDYLPESMKGYCEEPLILSTPVNARKTDLTDLLRGNGKDALVEVTFDALGRARRLGKNYQELSC